MMLWDVETDGGVAVARYTNPPMNYFCRAAMAELGELIDGWRDPAVRVVILTGGPPGQFITHYSVEELVKLAGRRDLVRRLGPGLGHNYHDLLRRLSELAKRRNHFSGHARDALRQSESRPLTRLHGI